MQRIYKPQTLVTDINITPFTDVILVLLIIFMVATPLIAFNRLDIKLPESSRQETISDSKPVYISISAEGVVYLENKVLNKKDLKENIKAALKENPSVGVVLAADRLCRFKDVVSVMDVLETLGVKNLSVATMTEHH